MRNGADAVTVLPFDSPLGRPETLGRRIARNISHLLVSESHVARVADPAGGAYAVERLTDDLAAAAWEVLGRLDAAGDPEVELDALVTATAAERDQQVATRSRPITGLTEFPAVAARNLGFDRVPLLCAREVPVPGALPMVIRVLIHYHADDAHESKHVYLGEARALRKDLESAQ